MGAGERMWIWLGGGWEAARARQIQASSYWVELEGALACPGDSGAPVWAWQDGRARWVGMLVSGAGAQGACFSQASVLKSQAIDWESAP